MALYKKLSCVKYSHMGSGVLQKTTAIYHSLLLYQEMQLEPVTRGESYTTILCSDAAGISGPELISESKKKRGNVCCAQMSPHFNLFLGKMGFEFSVQRPSRFSSVTDAKANICRGMGVFHGTPMPVLSLHVLQQQGFLDTWMASRSVSN